MCCRTSLKWVQLLRHPNSSCCIFWPTAKKPQPGGPRPPTPTKVVNTTGNQTNVTPRSRGQQLQPEDHQAAAPSVHQPFLTLHRPEVTGTRTSLDVVLCRIMRTYTSTCPKAVESSSELSLEHCRSEEPEENIYTQTIGSASSLYVWPVSVHVSSNQYHSSLTLHLQHSSSNCWLKNHLEGSSSWSNWSSSPFPNVLCGNLQLRGSNIWAPRLWESSLWESGIDLHLLWTEPPDLDIVTLTYRRTVGTSVVHQL